MKIIIAASFITILVFVAASDAHAACSGVPIGGAYTVSASCSFGGTVDGVDAGNLTINAGTTLTINAGQTVVFNSGYSIFPNGTIARSATGQIKKTNLWMTDADIDNYPNSTTQTAQDSAPANGRRRNLMTTTSTADCDDTTNTKWQNLTGYTDADGDGYTVGSSGNVCSGSSLPSGYSATSSGTDCSDASANIFLNRTVATDSDQDGYGTSGASSQCAGSSTAVSGRTYYKNSAGSFAFIASASMLGTSDCNDASATLAPSRTWYTDGDGDGYNVGSTAGECQTISTWSNSACTTAGSDYAKNSAATCRRITTSGTDCLDSNASVNPDQVGWFWSNRGDGSFDYNCSGVEEERYTNFCPHEWDAGWETVKPPCGDWQTLCLTQCTTCDLSRQQCH